MANPPYSASVLIITENQDGFHVFIAHWGDTIDEVTGMPVPPSPAGFEQSLRASLPPPTFTKRRSFATRAALKTGFALHIDAPPPIGFSESP